MNQYHNPFHRSPVNHIQRIMRRQFRASGKRAFLRFGQRSVRRHGPLRAARNASYPQSGQALVEALVVLLGMLSLWVAVAWLARFQDMALQASHASRFSAFSLTRGGYPDLIGSVRRHYFSGPAHQWSDRRSRQLLRGGQPEVGLDINTDQVLLPNAQPGGAHENTSILRRQWRMHDSGMVTARVAVQPRPSGHIGAAGVKSMDAGLAYFDSWYPSMSRYTTILSGAGHASSDLAAQQRVAESDLGWSGSALRSRQIGQRVQEKVQPLDRGWNRPEPMFDWLQPWAGRVQEEHLGVERRE